MTIEGHVKESPPSSPHSGPDPSSLLSTWELHRGVARLRIDPVTGQRVSYSLALVASLPAWLQRAQRDFKDAGIPQAQWSDAAMLLLEGRANVAMCRMRQARWDEGMDIREWTSFCKALEEVLVEIDSRPSLLRRIRENPMATRMVGVGLIGAGSVVLAPAIAVGGLGAIGFTATGVAGTSIAAGVQSAVYGGATTGLFSVCRSIGATAAAPAVSSTLSAVGAVVVGVKILKSGAENGASSKANATGPTSNSFAPHQGTTYNTGTTLVPLRMDIRK